MNRYVEEHFVSNAWEEGEEELSVIRFKVVVQGKILRVWGAARFDVENVPVGPTLPSTLTGPKVSSSGLPVHWNMFNVKVYVDLRLASAIEFSLVQSRRCLTTQRSESIGERRQ